MGVQVNASHVWPECAPFLRNSSMDWTTWLQKSMPPNFRNKRDLTGLLGTGLGVLNTIDSEVLMNKLTTIGSDLVELQQPLQSSLLALGNNHWKLTKILPEWEDTEERDHEVIINALGTASENISLAIWCTQAQLWMQSVAAAVIREGGEGIFPAEIHKILWDNASDMERELQSWWVLVNFTYNPVTSVVTAFVLTLHDASVDLIHPIVPLGLNHEGTVLYPSEHRTWAQEIKGKWQTINLEPCTVRRQLGYICEGTLEGDKDTCLDTDPSTCHFETHPGKQTTSLVYIGQGCVCLRTACPIIKIDNQIVNETQFNLCVCNFVRIKGCDFSYRVPIISHQYIKANLATVQKILPVPIGMNLTLVAQLLKHNELGEIIKEIRDEGKETLITIHHDTETIKGWE
ncbi:uncharacterized protein LOC131378803 [Hirundo rustica]|uniref:uncharacterized protein LOC131378803 n=1 Tax=Hirundo rustica TaxID=43150 RepID=UPI0026729508|nr:uncharacterized protein LOC131378803 [Hirundo rustica]